MVFVRSFAPSRPRQRCGTGETASMTVQCQLTMIDNDRHYSTKGDMTRCLCFFVGSGDQDCCAAVHSVSINQGYEIFLSESG
jgi:hypothetical protein